MIRVPKYWLYFLLAIVCIIFTFQNDNRLFSYFGVSTYFNFFARIGLVIWTIWFLLLGIRGHVIFWSSFNHSYADFYGGYKLLWILFGLGSFFSLLGAISFSPNVEVSQTPPQKAAPIINTMPPTNIVKKNKTPTPQSSNCIHWTEITSSMNGQRICVFGDVYSIYNTQETATRINFSSERNNFFLYDIKYVYPDLGKGDCVVAEEILQLYNNKIPFMEISSLYKCEPWMK